MLEHRLGWPAQQLGDLGVGHVSQAGQVDGEALLRPEQVVCLVLRLGALDGVGAGAPRR